MSNYVMSNCVNPKHGKSGSVLDRVALPLLVLLLLLEAFLAFVADSTTAIVALASGLPLCMLTVLAYFLSVRKHEANSWLIIMRRIRKFAGLSTEKKSKPIGKKENVVNLLVAAMLLGYVAVFFALPPSIIDSTWFHVLLGVLSAPAIVFTFARVFFRRVGFGEEVPCG